MMQNYTEEDLIRFIYQEVEICEHFEIDYAVQNDQNLKEEYKALKETADMLPKFNYSPSDQSVMNILNYNKQSFVQSLV